MGAKLGLSAATFRAILRNLELILSDTSLQEFEPGRNGLGMNDRITHKKRRRQHRGRQSCFECEVDFRRNFRPGALSGLDEKQPSIREEGHVDRRGGRAILDTRSYRKCSQGEVGCAASTAVLWE